MNRDCMDTFRCNLREPCAKPDGLAAACLSKSC